MKWNVSPRLYGRELFARLDSQGPLVLSPAWWDERLMEWTMGDEAVKVQLFRFIDVLPLLRTPEEIARHLREYFQEAADASARLGPLRPALDAAARLAGPVARASRPAATPSGWPGGSSPAPISTKPLAAVARLRQRRLTFTVDLLGEATITESEAERNQDDYLHLIDGLSEQVNAWPTVDLIDRDHRGPLPRVNVSIKLSSPVQPVRSARPRRHQRGGAATGCGRSCGRPSGIGPSSTSTWSSTPSRT